MRWLAALLALVCLAEARPRFGDFRASIIIDPYILGGVEAVPGEFPHQLSQERLGASWSHSCGASLLATNAALSASHCVDGAAVGTIRVIAGLHRRSDQSIAQISNLISYTMHELYGIGSWTFPNDIAILNLATPIDTSPSHIGLLTLPPDNTNQFVGVVCTLSGWGRTSSSQILPDALQKVDIPVISTAECNAGMAGVIGADCDDSQIAVFDTALQKGSCNGDSGGPMNCPLAGVSVVAGVTSWGISSGGDCQPSFPSVYTRTSWFLSWIATHLP